MRKIHVSMSAILMSLMAVSVMACATPNTPRSTMAVASSEDMSPLEKKVYRAVAQLFVEEDGEKVFLCTVTMFAKNGKTTYGITASHCAAEDDAQSGRVNVSQEKFFINFNDDLKKGRYYPVKIVGAGYQHAGDDLLFLAAELDHEVEIIPLAETDASLGESIANVACPGGFGKQLFRGSVSLQKVLRDLVFNDINWTNNMFLQGDVGPGSSGSSGVSVRQQAIVAIVVGMLRDTPSVVTIPVSRAKAVWAQMRAGTYPHKMSAVSAKKTKKGATNGPSTAKLINQINDHFPNRPALNLPMPEKLPMPRHKQAP